MLGIFIVLAALVSVFFFALKKRVHRKAACFAMYKVRDDLVALVANETLSEDSPVFKHYYARVNSILAATPNVGFDHMLETLINHRKNKDFQQGLDCARAKLAEIRKQPDMKSPEVRKVVAEYYDASSKLMIAHSNVSRMVFLGLMHDQVLPVLDRVLPRVSQEVRYVKFAQEESNALVYLAK